MMHMLQVNRLVRASVVVSLLLLILVPAFAETRLALEQQEAAGTLRVLVDDREALTYQYGPRWAIPHVYPLRSPSGKLLLLQKAQPPQEFPHHRALWIVDHVQLQGHEAVDFYHCWKNYKNTKVPSAGYRHFIRHLGFTEQTTTKNSAAIGADLQWVINDKTPVLDEHRNMKIVALGDGEYLLDFSWKLVARHGDVKFVSDWVHYAWPYVRIHPQFSGEQGGRITNDRGETGQEATNAASAKWIDYSNTVDGVDEGLAVFIFPDGKQHKWLTRDYGTFGPRRGDAYSGTKFTLKRGGSLPGRVGILVHRGDVSSGQVAQRYQQYIEGKL